MAIRSMLTGASGLRGHQQMLDVVGNNLANVNTTAYKSQRLRFSDLIYTTLRSASAPSPPIGGINPQQVGLGTRVAGIDNIFDQGNIETSGNPLDLFIQDDGFFVLEGPGDEQVYSRAGAFATDSEGYLVDPATGFYVQRFGTTGDLGPETPEGLQTAGDNRIRIPFGQIIPGVITSRATLGGNLDAFAIGPLQEVLNTNAAYTTGGGTPATAATDLNLLDQTTLPYVGGDLITITGTTVDGTAVATTHTYAPGDTVADLLATISTAFGSGTPGGATATIDALGNIVVTADEVGPSSLTLSLADLRAGGNAFSSFAVTTEGKNGDTAVTAIEIFDSLGGSHIVTLTFEKIAQNTWNLSAAIDPDEATMTDGQVDNILFNNDGSLADITGAGLGDLDLEITGFANGAADMTIQLNLGTAGLFDGLSQFGGFTSATALDNDGFAPGSLIEVEVTANGTVNGLFDNGRRTEVAQLAMATFRNIEGLNRVGDNYFAVSPNSGIAQIGTGLTGARGSVIGGALETSNVDVALEFTRLIRGQRGYQVNARTIRVADEVFEETANLVR